MNFESEKIKSAAKRIKLSDDEKADILSACKNYKKPKKKYGRVIAAAAAVFAIVITAAVAAPYFMPKMGMVSHDKAESNEFLYSKDEVMSVPAEAAAQETGEGAAEFSTNEVAQAENSSEKSISAESKAKTEDNKSAGEAHYGGFFVPLRPAYSASEKLDVSGERLTDEEAGLYLEKNKETIGSSLSSSGVAADNIRFSEKGYYHLNYNGAEGKPLELKENFRDYLVYNGNKLIAIITLIKENGKVTDSIAFGAPWFDSFNKKLIAHKGEKLIFVWAANAEIIIAPDGSYFSSVGNDVSHYMEGLENPYEFFFTDLAVYIP